MTRATPPFFLVGNPRSGTKMLRELMNRSPDLWMSDIESHFIPNFTRRIAAYGDLADRAAFVRLADDIRRTRAAWYWARRDVVLDTDRWYARCVRYDWPGVLEGLFHLVWEQEVGDPSTSWDALLWGDKTPVYMAEVPLLADLFPASRFIHLVRDPRDCCLSTAKTWGNSPLRTAQEWADRIRVCSAAGVHLGPTRYLEIRYEDLVSDVRSHLDRLFGFLGVATPADAGEFLRVPENLGAARGARRVVATNAQKWKREMPVALRRKIERVTGDLLERHGYEREHPGLATRRLSPVALRCYRVRDAWRQVQFRAREQGSWLEGVRFLRAR